MDRHRERVEMVESQLRSRGISNLRVLEAFLRVPRERFVRAPDIDFAYGDHPLPIECGQTISQPYIVACMTEYARVQPRDRVLEIGTGSGYQAAILATLGAEIYTVERCQRLLRQAQCRWGELGIQDIHSRCADGFDGWAEHAPYAAVLVTCCAPEVPPPLASQVRVGGRLVMPMGDPHGIQSLHVMEKVSPDRWFVADRMEVRFVPLVRDTEEES